MSTGVCRQVCRQRLQPGPHAVRVGGEMEHFELDGVTGVKEGGKLTHLAIGNVEGQGRGGAAATNALEQAPPDDQGVSLAALGTQRLEAQAGAMPGQGYLRETRRYRPG